HVRYTCGRFVQTARPPPEPFDLPGLHVTTSAFRGRSLTFVIAGKKSPSLLASDHEEACVADRPEREGPETAVLIGGQFHEEAVHHHATRHHPAAPEYHGR